MAIIKKTKQTRTEIDLTGPQGNVFFLIGQGLRWGQDIFAWEKEEREAFKAEMMSDDYTHAVETFNNHFGFFCDLIMADPDTFTEEVSTRQCEILVDSLMPPESVEAHA